MNLPDFMQRVFDQLAGHQRLDVVVSPGMKGPIQRHLSDAGVDYVTVQESEYCPTDRFIIVQSGQRIIRAELNELIAYLKGL